MTCAAGCAAVRLGRRVVAQRCSRALSATAPAEARRACRSRPRLEAREAADDVVTGAAGGG